MTNFEYVVDANVIFSSLISGKAIYKKLFEHYKFCSVDTLFLELDRHKEVVLTKTKLDEVQKVAYSLELFKNIAFFPAIFLPKEAIAQSKILCKTVDIDDFLYIALAITIDKPLATRDIKLYNGLRKQKFKNIVLLQDLLDTL